jgi:hypothetical protein
MDEENILIEVANVKYICLSDILFSPSRKVFEVTEKKCCYEYILELSSVGIATWYGLDERVSIPGRRKRCFSTPQRPDQLWGQSRLLSNRYRGVKKAGE